MSSIHEQDVDSGEPHRVTTPCLGFLRLSPREVNLPRNSRMSSGNCRTQDISNMKIIPESWDGRTRKAILYNLSPGSSYRWSRTASRGETLWHHNFRLLESRPFKTPWFCAVPLKMECFIPPRTGLFLTQTTSFIESRKLQGMTITFTNLPSSAYHGSTVQTTQ